MRTIGLVALLFAACGTKHPPITIAIAADGTVRVAGKALSLDQLGSMLAARREAGPKEEVNHAVGVSALPVLVDPAEEAAWAHVSWVITVLAEQEFWRLSFPGGREAPLPVDSGLCPSTDPPDSVALLLRVLVREDGAYAFGSRTTRDVAEIGAWIDEAPRENVACRIGVIRAQPRSRWRDVRAVFDLLRSRGADRIEFHVTFIPTREQRGRSPPPPPRSDRLPARWGGPQAVEYWSRLGRYPEEEELTLEDELAALVDGHREGLGLFPLDSHVALADAARLHAEEMDRMGYFGHFSPVPANRSPSDRLAAQGWPPERAHAELLAKADTAADALAAMLGKPENAKLLADPAFGYAGVARSGDCWVVLLGAGR